MPTISKDDFLACLRSAEVIEPSILDGALTEIQSEDAKVVARDLVRQNLLTMWQARFLISGRSQLNIGNYQLLDRLGRSEQGDRFLAVHTSLDRNVEIQILPAALSKDPDTIDQFIQKSSRASMIDHPNLVHVYDIDQERDRYYLVEEHVDGQPLAEKAAELSVFQIGRILRQGISGLLNAHQNQVVHGQVSIGNLMVTRDNQLKIANLALTPLVQTDFDQYSVFDLHDIALIGRELLLEKQAANPTQAGELMNFVDQIGGIATHAEITKPMENLDRWISMNDPESSTPTLEAVEEVHELAAEDGSSTGPDEDVVASSRPFVMVWLKQNPVMATGIIGVSALMLLGLTIWIGYSFSKDRNPEIAERPIINQDSTSPEKTKPDEQPEPVNVGEIVANLPGDATGLAPIEKQFPAKQKQDPAVLNQPPVSVNEPPTPPKNAGTDTQPVNAQTIPPTNPDAGNPNRADKTPAAGDPNPAAGDPKPPAGNQNTAAAEPKSNDDSQKPPAAVDPKDSVAETKPKEPVGEFESLGEHTNLPELTSIGIHNIGKVNLAKNYLLGLQLISGKPVSKARLTFEMKRTENDKQKWAVHFKRRTKDPLVVIGHFSKQDSEFSFQWSPEAAQHEDAGYLSNCMLRLTGKSGSAFLALRKPVVIEGLKITEEEMSVEVDSEIGWLPHSDFLKIEIQPFRNKDVKELMVEPRLVERKSPGRIFFASEPAMRFGWLEVSSESRTKLRLELATYLQAAPKPKQVSLEQVSEFASIFKAQAELSRKQVEQLRTAKRPPTMNDPQFNAFKQQRNAENAMLQKQAIVAINLENSIRAMLGKPIPLSIYYELNGVRVVIAHTK